jgi:diguanylate cyclase (GGDEF)-like protein/PAS domain S-box-containing protein
LKNKSSWFLNYRFHFLARLIFRPFVTRTSIVRIASGGKRKVAKIAKNISNQKLVNQALREREKRFRELFEQLPNIAVQGYTPDRKIIYWNEASHRLYGYTQLEAVGEKIDELIVPENLHDTVKIAINNLVKNDISIPSGELELCHKDGRLIPVLSSHIKLHNIRGQAELYCIDIDLSENKKAQARIEQLAYYDELTKLPNRRLFLDRLNQELIAERRHQTFGAVLFLDLDNFKTLNDALGHTVGDALLCQVGQRMIDALREEDTVARMGGDEFVVLLKELGENQETAANKAQQITEKIQTVLCQAYQLESHDHVITPSIGITVFPANKETTPETILKHADSAMYRAKKNGRNCFSFYHSSMQLIADQRLAMEKDLRHAISHNEFQLYFQTQVNTAGSIIGAEALLRWNHPTKGIVFPAEFITIAEETGLIIAIGEWVLKTACEHLKTWKQQGLGNDFQLAINVSPKQFHLKGFVEKTMNIIGTYEIDAKQLSFEISESIMIDNLETTISKMQALKDAGINFAIDDFGTGYSSLAYLKQLPITQLKVDQTFIRDINKNRNGEAIVETIISMANLLGLQAIAEGVENEEQKDFLAAKGCSIYQGYRFSQPVPEDIFLNLLGLS